MALQLAKQISIDKFKLPINIYYEAYTNDNINYEYYITDNGEYIQQVIDAGFYNDTINNKINEEIDFFGSQRNGNEIYFPKEDTRDFDKKVSYLIQVITLISKGIATGDLT